MAERKILATELRAEDLEGKKLKVSYEAGGVEKWKLFFDGEKSNLIAADYVPTSLLDMTDYSVFVKEGAEYTVYSEPDAAELVAWMRDPAKWEKFASGIPGAKAAGGPTIEQFCGCWNVLNPQQKVSLNNRSIELERPKKLFVPHKDIGNDCRGYLLASTFAGSLVWYVYNIYNFNGVNFYYVDFEHTYGVRPLVTLPSEVGLQYDEERKMWLLV